MKKTILAAIVIAALGQSASAQTKPVTVSKVVNTEIDFDKLVDRKGIKDGFLSVADVEGIVFKPNPVKISEFYSTIDKQPGKLRWQPKVARISANGDLGYTAGPYVYQNGKSDDDKVYGEYVSIWRLDSDNKFKLLIDLGIQHPEPETEATGTDFKEPDLSRQKAASKDPFNGKKILMDNDRLLNSLFKKSAAAAYKEFFSPEGRYYFPGFEPLVGSDKVMKFVTNEAITISSETLNAGRASSDDLAYSYGTARIKKGNVVNNYYYVRIWEQDTRHNWNVALEIFSTIE